MWKQVFPQHETYVYKADDGTTRVVTILRAIQPGRKYLGLDFKYSAYYITGSFNMPDFYKVKVNPLKRISLCTDTDKSYYKGLAASRRQHCKSIIIYNML